ncbi:MAG: hypothetical protein ACWGQW_06570 [bacterium]
MKGRPRRVENEVAKHVSKFLAGYDLPEVERIPVLGRTGPDIGVWPVFKVAVDCKSRLAVPKGYKLYGDHLQQWERNGHWEVGCRLGDLERLFDAENFVEHLQRDASVTVQGWLEHMDKWCRDPARSGSQYIAALVLHWPNTPIINSTFVIHNDDRRLLDARRKQRIDDLQHSASDE